MFLKLILASTVSASLPRSALFMLVVDSRPWWQLMQILLSSATNLPSASLPPRLTVFPEGKVTEAIASRLGQLASSWQVEHMKPLEGGRLARPVVVVVPVPVTTTEPPLWTKVGKPWAVWHFTQAKGTSPASSQSRNGRVLPAK